MAGPLQTLFGFIDRIEVLAETVTIGRTQLAVDATGAGQDRVEDAVAGVQFAASHFLLGGRGLAKEAVEEHLGVADSLKFHPVPVPRPAVAAADIQRQRCEPGLRTDPVGGVLVQGIHAAAIETEPFTGQECLHALVPATDPVVETLDDRPPFSPRFQGFEQLGHLEVRTGCFREERRSVHPVLGSDTDQSLGISGSGPLGPGCAKRHRLQQWQTDRDTGAVEERATVEFQGTK